jgi:hypothetical protein
MKYKEKNLSINGKSREMPPFLSGAQILVRNILTFAYRCVPLRTKITGRWKNRLLSAHRNWTLRYWTLIWTQKTGKNISFLTPHLELAWHFSEGHFRANHLANHSPAYQNRHIYQLFSTLKFKEKK